ncbi:hypothetical protein HZI73_22415 [Vallitalea pronyensis]|uniref:Uncharacterized protein n=1 Tax=Vallitalea pronyensis TaxID=1348613 RepID=A0A8J8SIX1_9FIRM|nr:hypothetical protein [Vallitalea pronyensis]QUI24884.1 hypothetical protein HZI73_22415 [Vallitalea pronyensis]
MKLKQLEQFRNQANEIKMLERRIQKLEQDVSDCVADTVKASSKHFPYIQHTVRIVGVDAIKIDKINRIKERLNKRKAKLINEMEKVETFIDSLDDSVVRQIVTLRYVEGLEWNSVARQVYRFPNGDTARKKVKRFFEAI